MEQINYRLALPEELEKIYHLLKECELPCEDILTKQLIFYIAYIDEGLIASSGLEIYGSVALFRSCCVVKKYRNKGIASVLISKLLSYASNEGVKKVYLLTTGADKYFETHGFKIINRTEAPSIIQETDEFSSICPSSAVCLQKNIGFLKSLFNKEN